MPARHDTQNALVFVPLSPEKAPRGVPRYRDPQHPFNTWTGIGKRPAWLRRYLENGGTLADLKIRDSA